MQHLVISSSNTTSSVPSSPGDDADDDHDFIDMDVKTTTFLCYSDIINSASSPEFEFMSSSKATAVLPHQHQQQLQHQQEEEEEGSGYNDNNKIIKYSSSEFTFISPADELFYKGQLLPLHLPPRLQMVQKLHALTTTTTTSTCNPINTTNNDCGGAESKRRLIFDSCSSYSTGVTPFESCNVTPSESCQVSGEINPDQYFFFHHGNGNGNDIVKLPLQTKKTWWSKRIKQSMKASRDYLRSLFGKSAGCSPDDDDDHHHHHHHYSAAAASDLKNRKDDPHQLIIGENSAVKKKGGHNSKVVYKKSRNNGFGSHEICKLKRGGKKISSSIGDLDTGHRKSFSGAIKAFSTAPNKSSSSSSSSNSTNTSNSSSSSSSSCVNGIEGTVHLLKRSSSVNSEVENSIQGAIAYCKQSQLKKEQYSCSDDDCAAAAANHQHGFFTNLSATNSKIVSSETQER